MIQFSLPINTEFELVTAEQLAWQKGRDDVTDEDLRQAVKMVARWNLTRVKRQQKVIV